MKRTRSLNTLVLCTAAGLATSALAQTNYVEVEPNDNKSIANLVTLAPGDSVSGMTTGTSTTIPGDGSADYFLVKTTPAAPGIYRHRLTLSNTTAGNVASIQGLTQSGGIINLTSDTAAQTGRIPVGTTDRIVTWYGFGKEEQIFYRVTGLASTTGTYTAVLSTEPVMAYEITTPFQAGPITIDRGLASTMDADFWVYDGDFNAIPTFGNDEPNILNRDFYAGTYYLAWTNWNFANDQPAAFDDTYKSGTVIDFPNAALNNSTTLVANAGLRITDLAGPQQFALAKNEPHEIIWVKFTVTGTVGEGACCFGNGSCSQLTASQCLAQGGTYSGNGTTCAANPCPQPGACCFSNGGCTLATTSNCGAQGGVFHGENTTCAAICPPPSDKLVPPNFNAPGASWAYNPNYTQALSGPLNANAVRLVATAAAALPGAWQNDARMDLTSPSGSTLSIGSSGAVSWNASGVYLSGTLPAGSSAAQQIDATFMWNFGPMTGDWSVNFRNNWSSGNIIWSNIEVIPLQLDDGGCCLPSGACEMRLEPLCIAAGGAFRGPGSDCVAPCPQPGSCCLPDGHCRVVSPATCTAMGGTFTGQPSCVGAACDQPLHHNGYFITHPGAGHEGADISRASANFDFGGSNATLIAPGPHFRLADDFTVTGGGGWNVQGIVLYAYMTSTAYTIPPLSPITGANVNIWDGSPGSPSSNIVASSNSMVSTGWTGVYRIFSTAPLTNRERPVMFVHVDFAGQHLPQGTYWVDYQFSGNIGGITTVWGPYIVEADAAGNSVTPPGDGLQRSDVGWHSLGTAPSTLPYAPGLPFAIVGTAGGTCYANCDNSTVPPILNVEDFSCFINEFAQAQALPHEQQLTHYANCDQSTTPPVLNVEDFSCFINKFAQGCP
jgi:hypothetical protein